MTVAWTNLQSENLSTQRLSKLTPRKSEKVGQRLWYGQNDSRKSRPNVSGLDKITARKTKKRKPKSHGIGKMTVIKSERVGQRLWSDKHFSRNILHNLLLYHKLSFNTCSRLYPTVPEPLSIFSYYLLGNQTK